MQTIIGISEAGKTGNYSTKLTSFFNSLPFQNYSSSSSKSRWKKRRTNLLINFIKMKLILETCLMHWDLIKLVSWWVYTHLCLWPLWLTSVTTDFSDIEIFPILHLFASVYISIIRFYGKGNFLKSFIVYFIKMKIFIKVLLLNLL